MKKFKKIVILDSVIFYPAHRKILNSLADEIIEYPSSLPDNLEKQYKENPESFKNLECYTQLGKSDSPIQLLMNRVKDAEVIISCWTDIPDEILKLNKNLKVVIFWTHEKEHRINIDLARKLNIQVKNIPDYGTKSVSELVFAGIFELIKRNFERKEKTSFNDYLYFILRNLFEFYRLYLKNEKYTRHGRFLHHFHKLGKIDFTISNDKDLEKAIPEKLIEKKSVGILNLGELGDFLEDKLSKSFGILTSSINNPDFNSSEYYDFIFSNEVFVIDSSKLNRIQLEKITIFVQNSNKLIIDLKTVESFNYDLNKKKFGIIGLGRIGKLVSTIAQNLGCEVFYYSRERKLDFEKEKGIKFMDLDSLLANCEIISMHIPSHKANNLLSSEKLKLIKKNTLFINTADGNLVDQHFLTSLMKSHKIFASLDVYPGLATKDVLGLSKDLNDWKIKTALSNCLLTYRAGWKTQESIGVKTNKLLGYLIDYGK